MKASRMHRFALLLLLALPIAARADDEPRGEHARAAPPPPAAYTQECGACHTAYPARLLPRASWSSHMSTLNRHFGQDASLDAPSAQAINAWLQANASDRAPQGQAKHASLQPPPQDRITRSAWFERKHRGIHAATWALPSVRRASNCAACHGDADTGRFSERALRQPEGLGLLQRLRWGD